MSASRALRFVTVTVGSILAGAAVAGTPALVVDVDSGKVLYAERATDPWFPASITKLMTTYVALDLVRAGKASMDQLLTLSDEAAAQPPSKMGFKPGTQLTLDNALKIIMVKSANDIAQTIAENLGGSVDGFAVLMNETAQRLGMRESRWVNPHGLPDDRQQTSARDMAILGRALLRDFPDHKDLFHIGAIQFGRSIMRNHNGLIGRYPGADGMKTGFICAGGFNVVASATHDGRRLITVVLGSSTANERNLKAADLFDRGFVSTGWAGQGLEELSPSALMAPPNMRAVVCDRRGPLPAEEDAPSAAASASGGPASPGGNAENPNAAMFASSSLAFAGLGTSIAPTRRDLGPRAPVQPIRVWLGATPPAALAAASRSAGPGDKPAPEKAVADKLMPNKALAEKPLPERKGAIAAAKVQLKPLARGRAGAVPAAAQAFTAMPTPSIIDDGKGGAKGAIRPSAAFVPASAPNNDAGADLSPAKAPSGAKAPAGVKSVLAKPAAAKPGTGQPAAGKLAVAKPGVARTAPVAAKSDASPADPAKDAGPAKPGAKLATKPGVKPATKPAARPKASQDSAGSSTEKP